MKKFFSELNLQKFPKIIAVGFLGLVLIILPSYSPFFLIPFDSKRFFQLCFLLLIAVIVVFYNRKAETVANIFNSFPKPVKIGLIVVLGIGLVSSALSKYPLFAFLEVSLYVVLFIFTLVTASFYQSHKDVFERIFLGVLSFFFLLYFINFAASYVQSFIINGYPLWPSTGFINISIEGKKVYPDPFLGFVNVRFFNQIQTWLLPFFILLIIRIPKKDWAFRCLGFLSLSFFWMLMFASVARGTFISSILALLLVLFIFRKSVIEYVKVFISSLVTGGIFYFLAFKIPEYFERFVTDEFYKPVTSSAGTFKRLKLWEDAMQLIVENPFLGFGPMHYSYFKNHFYSAHPHNSILQFASEWGTPTAGVILVIGVYAYFKFLNRSNEIVNSDKTDIQRNILPVALVSSLTAGIVHSFMSGLIVMPMSQLYMAIIIGWAIGYYQTYDNWGKKDKSSNFKIIGFRIVTLIAAVILLYGSLRSLNKLDESRNRYLEQDPSNSLSPRYWDQGFIGIKEN